MKFKIRNKYLTFGSPKIGNEEISEVSKVINSGWIGTGPKTIKFEKKFSEFKKIKYAQAVSSCTSALHLSLLATGLQKGDEVVTTANTFCATVNSIIHAGGIPKLVDIDASTGNIDINLLENCITKKTKVIIPVHYGGYPCEMDKIMKIAKKYNLDVIEDCAHAIETEYKGIKAGSFGSFGCFSFYVTKNLVTAEGGMVITNNKTKAKFLKNMSLHGMSKDAWKRFSKSGYKHYDIVDAGFKYNMTDIESAMGLVQLKNINKNWIVRKKLWNRYYEKLNFTPIKILKKPLKHTKHAYHLFPILIQKKDTGYNRDEFINELHKRNIGSGIHYNSIASYKFYKKLLKLNPKNYINSIKFGNNVISLPLSANMDISDVDYVISAIENILSLGKY